MNFKEAMQHVIIGGKVLRNKWQDPEGFFRIYVSLNTKSVILSMSEFDYVKNKLIVSFFDEKSEKIQPIMETVVRQYSTNSFLYVFNEEDAKAEDWEIME